MDAMWNSSFHPQLKPARCPSSVLQCCRGNVFSTLSVTEGCLNFGTLKVFEENKLTLKIKNQGKYDIAFKWVSDALFLAAGNVLARLCLRKFSEYSNEYMFVFFPLHEVFNSADSSHPARPGLCFHCEPPEWNSKEPWQGLNAPHLL